MLRNLLTPMLVWQLLVPPGAALALLRAVTPADEQRPAEPPAKICPCTQEVGCNCCGCCEEPSDNASDNPSADDGSDESPALSSSAGRCNCAPADSLLAAGDYLPHAAPVIRTLCAPMTERVPDASRTSLTLPWPVDPPPPRPVA